MHSRTLATENGSIHILETNAPTNARDSQQLPVVFVHGMACSANLWEAQLEYIAQTRRAIALDLRGHGASTPLQTITTLPPLVLPISSQF